MLFRSASLSGFTRSVAPGMAIGHHPVRVNRTWAGASLRQRAGGLAAHWQLTSWPQPFQPEDDEERWTRTSLFHKGLMGSSPSSVALSGRKPATLGA